MPVSPETPDLLDDRETLPRVRTVTRWERTWRPFWVLPVAICLAALAAGVLLPWLDARFPDRTPFLFGGGPDAARGILGTIASAMISVTGLVFSITMVVLQLASSQFTPRVQDEFLNSRVVQVTLGIFAASFIYALTVLRTVQGDYGNAGAFVPQASVTVAFLLVLASVGLFLAFIHHITTSIQVTRIVASVSRTTIEVIRRYFPTTPARSSDVAWEPPPGATPVEVLALERSGTLTQVHHRGLLTLAEEHDVVIEVLPQVGEFLPEGSLLARIWSSDGEPSPEAVARRLELAAERANHQDPAYGIRKLVDIAERALSTGINDPTTAVQVLESMHRPLRLLVQRHDAPSVVSADGTVRLVHQPQRIEEILDLAFEEVLHYGKDGLQVPRTLLRLLDDLHRVSRPEHRDRLEHWRRVTRGVLTPEAR